MSVLNLSSYSIVERIENDEVAPHKGRSTLRQKRFRRYLFTEQELAARGAQLEIALSPIYTAWQNRSKCEPEIVAEYIDVFLRVFRPRDYRGGPHGENLSQNLEALPPLVREFAVRSYRSVPLAVNRALVSWAEGRSDLKIVDYVPDSLAVLKAQSQGQRIVTCIFAAEKLTKFVESTRDPLGFVLHDLIHADHFFRQPDWFIGQKKFYENTLRRLQMGEFAAILADEKSARRFEYVISDMNSHPAHLEQSLNSITTVS